MKEYRTFLANKKKPLSIAEYTFFEQLVDNRKAFEINSN